MTRFTLAALFALALAAPAMAAGEDGTLDPIHHVADGYYLDFLPFAKVELPRLFVVRRADGSLGFDAFGSTAAALRSGRYQPEDTHGPAHEGDTAAVPTHAAIEDSLMSTQAGLADPPVEAYDSPEALIESGKHLDAHLVPVAGSVIIDLSMTRHLVFALLASLLLFLAATSVARKYARGIGRTSAPRGTFQNMMEVLITFVRDEIARPNIGEAKYKKFLPYLLTAFFFIFISNLLGLVPFGATATSNIAITAVLAIFTFLITQIFASKDHWMHIFWPPGVPAFVKPILIPVEILGLFTKPFALAIRLFANLTAGHLVILSLVGLIFTFTNLFGTAGGIGVAPVSVAFSLFIYVLELLVAFIQAYVFTMLSSLFIGMAVQEHDHHPEHHEPVSGHADAHLSHLNGTAAINE